MADDPGLEERIVKLQRALVDLIEILEQFFNSEFLGATGITESDGRRVPPHTGRLANALANLDALRKQLVAPRTRRRRHDA